VGTLVVCLSTTSFNWSLLLVIISLFHALLICRGRGVCLSTTRFTRYDPKAVDDNLLDLVYEPREV